MAVSWRLRGAEVLEKLFSKRSALFDSMLQERPVPRHPNLTLEPGDQHGPRSNTPEQERDLHESRLQSWVVLLLIQGPNDFVHNLYEEDLHTHIGVKPPRTSLQK